MSRFACVATVLVVVLLMHQSGAVSPPSKAKNGMSQIAKEQAAQNLLESSERSAASPENKADQGEGSEGSEESSESAESSEGSETSKAESSAGIQTIDAPPKAQSTKPPSLNKVVDSAMKAAMPDDTASQSGNTASSPSPSFGRVTKLVRQALKTAAGDKDLPVEEEMENPDPCERPNAETLLKDMKGCQLPENADELEAELNGEESSEEGSEASAAKGAEASAPKAEASAAKGAESSAEQSAGAEGSAPKGAAAVNKLRLSLESTLQEIQKKIQKLNDAKSEGSQAA